MSIGTDAPSSSAAGAAGVPAGSLDDGRFETVPRELVETEAETQAEREARLRRETEKAADDRKERPPKAAG